MESKTCKDCTGVRGIKVFNCLYCGKKSNNYANGLDICLECCGKQNRCCICGKGIEINLSPMIEIDGIIDLERNPLTHEEFVDKFIEWVESNDWDFGGGIKPYKDEV